MKLPMRISIEDRARFFTHGRVSTIFCKGQPKPLMVEWPDTWSFQGRIESDGTVLLHTFDNVRQTTSTYALGREEALALSDALRRAALS